MTYLLKPTPKRTKNVRQGPPKALKAALAKATGVRVAPQPIPAAGSARKSKSVAAEPGVQPPRAPARSAQNTAAAKARPDHVLISRSDGSARGAVRIPGRTCDTCKMTNITCTWAVRVVNDGSKHSTKVQRIREHCVPCDAAGPCLLDGTEAVAIAFPHGWQADMPLDIVDVLHTQNQPAPASPPPTGLSLATTSISKGQIPAAPSSCSASTTVAAPLVDNLQRRATSYHGAQERVQAPSPALLWPEPLIENATRETTSVLVTKIEELVNAVKDVHTEQLQHTELMNMLLRRLPGGFPPAPARVEDALNTSQGEGSRGRRRRNFSSEGESVFKPLKRVRTVQQ